MRYETRKRLLAYTSATVLALNTIAPATAATTAPHDRDTTTPIKHVIIIVGENRSFDHLFATYVPPTGTVLNMLSQGIINADGTPAPMRHSRRRIRPLIRPPTASRQAASSHTRPAAATRFRPS